MHRHTALLSLLAGVLAALLSFGCSESPVVIGLAAPLQGVYADLGVQGRNGAMLAAEEINSRGGIDGRPIQLEILDDGNTPEEALRADAELRKRGAAAIIGHFTSTISIATVSAANESGTLLISPSTSTPALTGKDDMFLRVMTDSDKWATALARYAANVYGARRLLIVRDLDNSAFSVPYATAFAKEFASSPDGVTFYDFHSTRRESWDPLLELYADEPFDSLLFVCSARDTADLARHLSAMRLDRPMFMSPWSYTSEIVTLGGDAVEGIVSCMIFTGDTIDPAYVDFRKRFVARFGYEPNFAAVFSYECMAVLASALRTTGGEPDGLKEAILSKESYSGLLGTFRFDQNGDVSRPYFIVTIRDGELVSMGKAHE